MVDYRKIGPMSSNRKFLCNFYLVHLNESWGLYDFEVPQFSADQTLMAHEFLVAILEGANPYPALCVILFVRMLVTENQETFITLCGTVQILASAVHMTDHYCSTHACWGIANHSRISCPPLFPCLRLLWSQSHVGGKGSPPPASDRVKPFLSEFNHSISQMLCFCHLIASL